MNYYRRNVYDRWVEYNRPIAEEYFELQKKLAHREGVKHAVTTWPPHYFEVPYTTRWYRLNGFVCV